MSRRISTSKAKEDALLRVIVKGMRVNASSAEVMDSYEKRKEIFILLQPVVEGIVEFYQGKGFSKKDLIKAGNIGIRKALLHYDITKKYKFSTYSTWWIKAEIHKLLGLPVDKV